MCYLARSECLFVCLACACVSRSLATATHPMESRDCALSTAQKIMSTYATKSAGMRDAISKLHTVIEVSVRSKAIIPSNRGSKLLLNLAKHPFPHSGRALFLLRLLIFSLSRTFQCAVEGSRIFCREHKQEQHIHINVQCGPKSRRNPATKGKGGKTRKTSVSPEVQSTCDSPQGVNGTRRLSQRVDDVGSHDDEEVMGLGPGSGEEI
jgi:hypothetical protein